jgi:hypothetical protein
VSSKAERPLLPCSEPRQPVVTSARRPVFIRGFAAEADQAQDKEAEVIVRDQQCSALLDEKALANARVPRLRT